MKLRLLLFVIGLSSACTAVAQTIETLDASNGFRSLVLNDSLSAYEGKLGTGKKLVKSKLTSYLYTADEPDLFSVFDLKIDSIRLFFSTTTLRLEGFELIKSYPAISKDHYTQALEDNKKIVQGFLPLFGNRIGKIDRKNTTQDLGVYWMGDKVTLNAYTKQLGRKGGSANVVSFFKTSFFYGK